ncbi:hypothetical protein [Defluviimonas sp. SAOS-178_SWC]|uniref:hypothetical protein n=1 Tax=Defluviimonas sp. SAOS-178_SWC TaxID=3121287 RepID=UPI003221743A
MRILADPVPIGRIFLDLTNPRHVDLATEDEVIEYLCDKEDVWSLARDIAHIGLNPLERVALVPVKGQKDAYTMAEGNRRLCALKLLADPDRAPARLRKGFSTLAAQRRPPKSFAAVVFDNDEEVRPWLERMHNGAYDGRGRKAWNAEQSQRYSGSNKNKVAQAFLDYAQHEGLISSEERKGKLTTVQRFLGIDVFREAMGLDQANPEDLARTRPKAEFDTIARRFIRDLVEGKVVNSRMNKPKIIEYARPLGSLPGVTATRTEPESLASNGDGTKPRKRTRKTPRKPEKVRHIQYADEIASALKAYGNHKLESLYHSICTVELEGHTPLVCIGVWAFMETLTACAGRHDGTSFDSFLSNNRLEGYGLTGKTIRTAIRSALTRTQDYGNSTKHEALAATFNGDQVNNDLSVLKPVILKCIEAAASKP